MLCVAVCRAARVCYSGLGAADPAVRVEGGTVGPWQLEHNVGRCGSLGRFFIQSISKVNGLREGFRKKKFKGRGLRGGVQGKEVEGRGSEERAPWG